jgi:hypothetical protein
MTLDVAKATLPQRRLANQKFVLEYELAVDDPSAPNGVPEDAGDVTAARVTAEQIVPAGVEPPAATVWTLGDGVTLPIAADADGNFTVLTVSEPTGLAAGGWLIKGSLTRSGGAVDWVFEDVLELTEQP